MCVCVCVCVCVPNLFSRQDVFYFMFRLVFEIMSQ